MLQRAIIGSAALLLVLFASSGYAAPGIDPITVLENAQRVLNLLSPKTKCCNADKTTGKPICYSNAAPFDHLPMPKCGEDIRPLTMKLYTRADPDVGQVVTCDSIPSNFDGSKETMFITHGWLGSMTLWSFYKEQVAAAVATGRNIIAVSWEGSSVNPNYLQSASDTRSVGAEIGVVVNKLKKEHGLAIANIWCIGHSLGAHVCGHAGAYTRIGRITGLDAAGPCFDTHDVSVGLNLASAEYVEVIHTNGKDSTLLQQGTMKRMGHVDFYVNGAGTQPECNQNRDLPELEKSFAIYTGANIVTGLLLDGLIGVCSHHVVVRYWMESLKSDCFKSRHRCTDQFNLPDSCSLSLNPVQAMGPSSIDYWKQGIRGIFYLAVGREPPYCQN